MSNIWELLLYSVNVTLVALMIITLKYIFKDLLSAKWQYGIWSVLFIRMLLPASSWRNILLPFMPYLESAKLQTEALLTSSYSDIYEMLSVSFPLPFVTKAPTSITDYLFIIYILGVIFSLFRYSAAYLRLRLVVKKGSAPSPEIMKRIDYVKEKYSLKGCRVVTVNTTSSAFICGFIKPVLVIPEEGEIHEDIILHELLHLKYKDTLHNALWCLFRCFNWFNPVMHFAFNTINNDIEVLCDRRVMKILQGEERREYGRVLLQMVNRKYQGVPATSSLSNGGKNISKRIESIAKYRKFPQGMALVSVCITLVVAVFCFFGSAADDVNIYHPEGKGEFYRSVSLARSQRAVSIFGAVDAYVKGTVNRNGIMLLSALEEEKQKEVIMEMEKNFAENVHGFYYSQGAYKDYIDYIDSASVYYIFNLERQSEDEYSCRVFLGMLHVFQEVMNDIERDYGKVKADKISVSEAYKYYTPNMTLELHLKKIKGRWCVVEEGDRGFCGGPLNDKSQLMDYYYKKQGENGIVEDVYYVEIRGNILNSEPDLKADLDYVMFMHDSRYVLEEDIIKANQGKSIYITRREYATEEKYYEEQKALQQTDESLEGNTGAYVTGSSNKGKSFTKDTIDEFFSGEIYCGGGGGGSDISPDYHLPEVIEIVVEIAGSEELDRFAIFTKEEWQ